MIEKFTQIGNELRKRIILNRLDAYEGLIEYYLEEANNSLASNNRIMYEYWSTKAMRCVDRFDKTVLELASIPD